MSKIFSFKILATTLISTSIAIALPARANENDLAESGRNSAFTIAQVDYSDRYNNNESENTFKNVVGITGLAIGTGIIGYHVRQAYKPALANSFSEVNNSSSTTLLTRVRPKLRRELLRLVHNRQTANRLMNGTSISHPDRSANWVAEKVIYDLKRDR